MKNTFILFTSLLITSFAIAQDRMDRNEKIKALKTAYITEKLDLTKAEAEKFWPIYNAFEERMHELRGQAYKDRKSVDIENMTEVEANNHLEKLKATNIERNNLYNQYIIDLQGVIASKKIILLKKVEEDFKRKMFEELKRRHHGKRNNP